MSKFWIKLEAKFSQQIRTNFWDLHKWSYDGENISTFSVPLFTVHVVIK